MLRRLFFLFPNEEQAQRVVDQLIDINISKRRIHAIAPGKKLWTLPGATKRQQNDTAFRAQSILWNFNLLLFALATIVFLITLITGDLFWIIAALAIMLVTFFAGEQFVVRVPDVHLTEFTDALSHGEILLMVDVPASRVAEIENFVHRRHPEAVVGGVGWSMDAFGI
ncbi:MAG: hypothetical protein ACC650_05555 [Gammaproteobacteria bacterium]